MSLSQPGSPRQLKEASKDWVSMSCQAYARQTEERRKYGETFTTAADILEAQEEARARSMPSSPFSTGVRLSFDEDMIARLRSLKRRRRGEEPGGQEALPTASQGSQAFSAASQGSQAFSAASQGSQAFSAASQGSQALNETSQGVTEVVPLEEFTLLVPEDTADEIDGDSQCLTDKDKTKSASILLPSKHGWLPSKVIAFRRSFALFTTTHSKRLCTVGWTILFLLFAAYFGWVLAYNPSKGFLLIVVTAAAVLLSVYAYLRDFYGDRVMKVVCVPLANRWRTRHWVLDWVLIGLILVGLGLFIGLDLAKHPIQLRSLVGMVVIISFSYLNSTDPGAVRWRPVIWGIGLQIVMGIIVLRWQPGYDIFFWISSRVQILLNYADHGSKFIFGDPQFMEHPIAFKVVPMVVFFSAITNMLFYLGVMQVIISKMSWLMQNTMQTTTIESLSVAGNIFFTLTEESFILRPYMPVLTMSELHAVMTGGSATVAGFALAMYIELGAPPIHVFSAAVMSAPAALAIAKLSLPETEESKTKTEGDVHLESGKDANVLEAAAVGATMSITVIAYAIVIIIAFYGLLGLINDLLSYAGDLVGHPEFSFELVCSYVFFPVAYVLGVPLVDCRHVASIMGMKYFGSDLIAYGRLGELRNQGLLEERSVMVTTYAVLGFSSLSSVGVSIGILGALCPERRQDVSNLALRAILNGNLASLLTACLAGLLNHH